MTPYVAASGCITPEQIALFNRMRFVLQQAPEIRWGEVIPSCHHVCHALARIFPATSVQSGYFGKGNTHSWLTLQPSLEAVQTDYRARIIADMYPVFAVDSFIVYTYYRTTWNGLYILKESVMEEVREQEPYFETRVGELVELLCRPT